MNITENTVRNPVQYITNFIVKIVFCFIGIPIIALISLAIIALLSITISGFVLLVALFACIFIVGFSLYCFVSSLIYGLIGRKFEKVEF